jgi:hypothetical protein
MNARARIIYRLVGPRRNFTASKHFADHSTDIRCGLERTGKPIAFSKCVLIVEVMVLYCALAFLQLLNFFRCIFLTRV